MTFQSITRSLSLGVAAAALVLGAQSAQALDNAGTLSGVVKNVAGQPVAGAFVRLRNNNADRKSTRLNSSHVSESRMPSSA